MNSQDIVNYLLAHPQFFNEHAELLAHIRLTSPVMGKTISLQERQMEVLREKHRDLELKLGNLMRVADENFSIAEKFQRWTRAMLTVRNDVELPHVLCSGLQHIFDLPYATLRLWNVDPEYQHSWFAEEVSEDVRIFAEGLREVFCGENMDFEAARWIQSQLPIRSVAMLPLREKLGSPCYGLLVLASDDVARYTKDMGTDFLQQIADTASAATSCLTGI